MDWSWLEDAERVEEHLYAAGLRLHDKWICSTLLRDEEPCQHSEASYSCVLCNLRWPQELLWPGRMKLRTSKEEADALAGGLSLQGQVVARYMLCSGRVRLPVNTLILKISDELDPVIDFLPPSLCPACSATVQRKPHKEDQAINSILVRSSSADLSNVPMRIALDVAQNVFYGNDHEHMIVDEEMLQLGYGHMALRLTVPSTASVYSALRLGLPGCSIDYLPSTPARLTVTVYPASVHLPHANSPSLNPSEVAQWLSSVGNCHVASYTSGCSAHAVVAELASVGCWHRALALNGELWQRTVMIVSATENFESHACTLSSRPSTRRIMLYWLRALSGLGVVAKRLVLAFLGDPPVMVPSDIGSLEDAMRVSRNVIIVGGHYTLPQGLKIRSPVNLIGDGQVFLHLGSPVQIRSEFGAELRNLTFLGEQTGESDNRSAVIAVQCSYLVAIGRGYRCYSDITPVGGRRAFACCSWGRPSITLTNCTIRGGHHGVDLRGGCGVRPRMGKSRRPILAFPATQYLEDGLDLGAWLERNRNQHQEVDMPSIEFSGKRAYVPGWKQHVMTFAQLIDCEISNSVTEAINAWRGARLEMTRCWIHNCGNDWSSAISLGRFMTSGFTRSQESELTKGFMPGSKGKSAGQYFLEAELLRNTLRCCNAGVICSRTNLLARSNQVEHVKFGAFQIFNGKTIMEENQIKQCAIALTARSGLSAAISWAAKLELRSNLLQMCEVGLRLSSARAQLEVNLSQDSLIGLGDGIVIQGSTSNVEMEGCRIADCKRMGIHAFKESNVTLRQCQILRNGRGVVIASGSRADISRSSFEGNTGWAVRFEGHPDDDLSLGSTSSIVGNSFGCPEKGNAGRKRVRVDTRSEMVRCLANSSPGEGLVEPEVKLQKTSHCAVLADEMAQLSLQTEML
ncbi:unnamed protein product [Durusdinium trenchii]|uniref:Right handed beta helix domain-containing protein n=1 Tax=Durusdinium trenchii TaxID=1381693 RepID=A0ABP0N5W2_9DINO